MRDITKEEAKIIKKICDLLEELEIPVALSFILGTLHYLGVTVKKEKYEEFKKLVLKGLENIEEERSKKDID
jgi:hypothetical protein